MKAKNVSAMLVIALAVIAAVVATGLIAGWSMWAVIVGYWIVLTAKNIVDYLAVRDSDKTNTITKKKESDAEMATVKLSAPWMKLYKEIQAMFKDDKEVKVVFDDEAKEIKLFVDSDEKAAALSYIIEGERIYGNVCVDITVYPANGWDNIDYDELAFDTEDPLSLYNTAFKDNPALSFVMKSSLPFWDGITYVVFRNCVVQFFNDDLSDVNGNCSTLYQEIAKDVFVNAMKEGVYFCTDTPQNLGEPLGEWP